MVLPQAPPGDALDRSLGAIAAAVSPLAEQLEFIAVSGQQGTSGKRGPAELAFNEAPVRLLVQPGERSRAASVRCGLRAARLPWILLLDTPRDFELTRLKDFAALAAHHDAVVGWRVMRRDSWRQRTTSAWRRRLIESVLHLRLHDPDCGAKLLRRELVEQVKLSPDGTESELELLLAARQLGADVAEVPLAHVPAGGRGVPARPWLPVTLRGLRRHVQALSPDQDLARTTSSNPIATLSSHR